MPERRGSRFVVEALFLAALTVALTLAHLDALEIVGAMALGWLVVAAIEWTVWRGEPHYGAGLPPRYYLPRVDLPPPQPLEQVVQGYPEPGRDDAPTWIASASLRAEVLGEWPHVAPARHDEEDEEPEPYFATPADEDADPWTVAAMPAAPVGEEVALRLPERTSRTARYTFDPLAGAPPAKRFGRRGAAAGVLEVPAVPSGERRLPGAAADA
ncbi:MAG: hypothetical protein ACTHKS_18275 [Gaiellaceae bacterium]